MVATRTQDKLDEPVLNYLRPDFVALRAEQTVAEALAHLRTRNLGERVVYFYVCDADKRLVGVLPTRRLLMAAPEARLESIMHRQVVHVRQSASLLLVCELFVLHRLLAVPVVDEQGRLAGIVDVGLFTDEVFDLSERQAAQDVFQLIGVRLAQTRAATTWAAFQRRWPWLLCNVAGGLICAVIIAQYEAFLDSLLVLALFVPVVLALSESVSMQSMTLTLQAMHHERSGAGLILRAVGREFLTAALLGGATGLLVGLIAWFWKSAVGVGVVIGLTIWSAVITACLLGVLLPTIIRALRADPRIAAGPIVLAIADVATLVLYFEVAAILLRPT